MSVQQSNAGDDSARARAGRGERAGAQGSRGDISYRSRPFSDLVDEDKHDFVRRRVCATLCGGYRTVADEVEAVPLGIGLHLAQFAIYLIMPAWILISTFLFGADETETRTVAMVMGGVVPFALNTTLMLISHYLSGQKVAKEPENAESGNVSCFSKAGYLFLFPAKQSIMETVVCGILTFLYSTLMVYLLHPVTYTNILQPQIDVTSGIEIGGIQVIQIILMSLSSYSLFSNHCPESSVYRDNDQEFTWGSNHYQRPTYFILIVLILILCEATQVKITEQFWYAINVALIVVYFMQVMGMLSHPVVTMLWAIEQLNLHVLGTTARASDIRIVLSFVINGCFVALSIYLGSELGQRAMLLSMVLLSLLASQNILMNIGIKKPFKAKSETHKAQKYYASIVLDEKQSSQGEPVPCEKWPVRYVAQTLVLALVVALMAVLESQSLLSDPEDAKPFVGAAAALTLIQWVISALTRFAVCRVIPCRHMEAGRGAVAVTTIMRLLITIILTYAFLKISMRDAFVMWPQLQVAGIGSLGTFGQVAMFAKVMKGVLMYRAFNRLYHYPLASSLEALVLLAYPTLEALALAAFALNRAHLLYNKLIYVAVSVATAVKNKKQRFASQNLCFALQFTIFLPLTLGVILITTLLDLATIPYLGFAFFIIGYPKPLRGWSAINPVSANPNDSRSDGHLYQAMMPQLSAQIQNVISTDPFNFGRGSYYFMKNEKMIVLIQVLERGHNYVMFAVKGTELQETTVCHAEENENMNNVTEELFERKQLSPHFAFSLSVLKQINFGVYDDQKVSLAGIIEHPDFAPLVEKAYMRIVMMQLQRLFQTRRTRLFRISQGEMNEKELANAVAAYDDRWLDHLQFRHRAIEFTRDRIATAQSGQNFKNQISPASQSRVEPVQGMTFLDRLEAQSSAGNQVQSQSTQALVQAQSPPRPRRSDPSQHEENKQESYRRESTQQSQNNQRVSRAGGVAAKPIAQSAVPLPNRQSKPKPMDDLDELEDMLDNMEGGERDELDDLLDDLGDMAPSKSKRETRPAATMGSSGLRPNPSATSAEAAGPEALDDWGPTMQSSPPIRSHGKKARLGIEDSQQQYQQEQRQQGGPSDIEKFAFQSFQLLFGDEFQNMPLKLLSIFKGKLRRTFDTRSFLEAEDEDILHLKAVILQSARVAFHFALESYFIDPGETTLPEHKEFENEIRQIDQEWFFGSEEYLWNAAIERNLPNLMRLIQKKDGQYFAHRLRFGQNAESTFSVFQFRREVIRGIWANLNLELLYYTNANDERFSIQAEKDILRNLLVQLAEIPLGYPVFSSGAQSTLF